MSCSHSFFYPQYLNTYSKGVKMKRIARCLFFLTFIITSQTFAQNVYYVDAINGNDQNDGLSETRAWKTISKVNDSSFNPGDSILFKRGETWNERLNPTDNTDGASGSPITFGAYGSGDLPLIDLVSDIPNWTFSGEWSNVAGDIWSISLSTDPKRIFLDGTEYIRAASSGTVDATNRWYHSSSTLYVYAESNPTFYYSSMQRGRGVEWYGIYLDGNDYITIEDIEIRGGGVGIYIGKSDYVIVDNCTIGLYTAHHGIEVRGLESSPYTPSVNGEIKNCTVKSGYNSSGYSSNVNRGFRGDGIVLHGSVQYFKIHDCEVANWGHSLISICNSSEPEGCECQYNEAYDNYLHAENVCYCRGMDFDAHNIDGTCAYNKFYRNYVKDTSVRCQVHGNHNEFYYNIIENVFDNGYGKSLTNGLGMFAAEGQKCHHNKIYNNIICNTDSHGITMHGQTGDGIKEDNLIRNNIIMNWGSGALGLILEIILVLLFRAILGKIIVFINLALAMLLTIEEQAGLLQSIITKAETTVTS